VCLAGGRPPLRRDSLGSNGGSLCEVGPGGIVITTKTVPLKIKFHGTGALEVTPNGYRGGIPEPKLGRGLGFEVWREVPDRDGGSNPVVGEPTVDGAFQLSLSGTAAGFRELARYFLALAELDVKRRSDFHEHHEAVSSDGRTRFHVIVRRRP
jgi:hypothetical protein